ncbi:MAG: hypothetical protein MUF58_00925 [Arcicella sp.]|jgi:hypothetical protein|nr:hypothetical protein [Arcicella sp.]
MGLEEFVLDRERRVGMAITRNERDLAFTKNLLEQTDFSKEKIANLADVDVEFVRKVKASLS